VAARGETVLAPAVAGRLLTRMRDGTAGAALSRRETAVLGLAARGLTNAEIGRELFIGGATVKPHLTRAARQAGGRGADGDGGTSHAARSAAADARVARPPGLKSGVLLS
jgi:DNA-binding CsgD family transcriptional regulator